MVRSVFAVKIVMVKFVCQGQDNNRTEKQDAKICQSLQTAGLRGFFKPVEVQRFFSAVLCCRMPHTV